jgi:predicted RNase H-like HicB family nuclease
VTTLIAVYNSEGCQGRCDAKCYDAAEPDCDCICGGRNHGAGKEQALDNTRELAESWLEQARANGQDITHAELAVTAMHEPLFNLKEVTQ